MRTKHYLYGVTCEANDRAIVWVGRHSIKWTFDWAVDVFFSRYDGKAIAVLNALGLLDNAESLIYGSKKTLLRAEAQLKAELMAVSAPIDGTKEIFPATPETLEIFEKWFK